MATDVIATARKRAAACAGRPAGHPRRSDVGFYLQGHRLDAAHHPPLQEEVMRLLAEVTFGTGALAVIGGTVGVITFICFFTGTEVGLQGYSALNQLGTGAFTGFISAYFNTREIAPLVAGLALSATVGCGFTAQLGAMRISEEIDALEVMAVPSIPYLVTTRIIAGFIAVIPLYVIGLLSSYAATYFIAVYYFKSVCGHLLALLPSLLAAARRALVVLQGAHFRDHRDPDPLLLRLHRQRRSGRCRCSRRTGRADRDRAGQRRRLLPVAGDLGLDVERPVGGIAVPKESLATVTKRRGLGVLYIVIIGSLIWLSIAIYQKKFTPVVLVNLKADHTGNALQSGSDVKERGIIVGSVRSVKVDSGPDGGCINQQVTCVTVTLALDPSRVGIIPTNVTAQILPKTIFGEQYVALEIPQRQAGPRSRQQAHRHPAGPIDSGRTRDREGARRPAAAAASRQAG